MVFGLLEMDDIELSHYKIRQTIVLYLLAALFLHNPIINAAQISSFGHRVFVLQEKMAHKGNPLAQYKLGTFYECGISVKNDVEEAKKWYEKASLKGHKPAANRLIYLQVEQQGYKSSLHSEWLKKIKEEASKKNIHSIIILGQLYHRGLGVKKNYTTAINLLNKAISKGHSEIDYEIEEIQKKIDSNNKKKLSKVVKKQATEEVIVKEQKKLKKKTVQNQPKKNIITTLGNTASKREKQQKKEKRRHYERAMRKQYHEQLILEQLQQWAEDDVNEWSEDITSDE